MKDKFKNPHPVDLYDYLKGNVFSLGGKDFEKEENLSHLSEKAFLNENQKIYKLDWSFLKKKSKI